MTGLTRRAIEAAMRKVDGGSHARSPYATLACPASRSPVGKTRRGGVRFKLPCRADGPGLAAAGRTTAAAVVVIGSGPAATSAVAAACGSRRRVHLPRSARVARAGLAGRVPAGLPGSWLRPLLPLARGRGGDPP